MKYIQIYDNVIHLKGDSKSNYYKKHVEKELHEYFSKVFGITCKPYLKYDGDYGITIKSSPSGALKGHFEFKFKKKTYMSLSLDNWTAYELYSFKMDGWFIGRFHIDFSQLKK